MQFKTILLLSFVISCQFFGCEFLTCSAQPLPGQRQVIEINVGNGFRVPAAARQRNDAILPSSEATLKTDPELESILEKADRFKRERQFGIAAKLWQSVLERSGDALYSTDGVIFYSLAEQVERVLAGLPNEGGLDAYRITADANAKEILAEANDPYDRRALQQIVRRFFISSIGDDSALLLSSLYMDDYDFVGAFRLLEKIVDVYPNPSVSLVDVYTRMALCQAMMGEAENAYEAVALAKGAAGGLQHARIDAVESSISSMVDQKFNRQSEERFVMELGNRNRSGVMPALPSRFMNGNLESVWQYYFAPNAFRWSDVERVRPIFGEDLNRRVAETITTKEKSLIEKWKNYGWRPSGNLLFDGNNVYFKTAVDLTVWDRSARSNEIVWRPLWRNRYEMDDYTKSMVEIRRRMNRGRVRVQNTKNIPDDDYEIQLFSDRIAAQMSIQDGVLYSIEGPRLDIDTPVANNSANSIRYNLSSRRSRSNKLTAYDAESGQLLWTLPPITEDDDGTAVKPDPFEDGAADAAAVPQLEMVAIDENADDSPWVTSGGFMAAPIHYGGLAIVPITHGGSISVYAIDPKQNGKTVWKSYLCDEAETGANPYAPINLSIDGSDLFASSGLGAVFILDPTNGLIRFAKRYKREGEVQYSSGRWGRKYRQTQYESWLADTVISFGRQMVCFSSDAKTIYSLDRNTGELIWQGDSEPQGSQVDYLLGVHKGILYAAGKETVLAYSLEEEGRMVWGGDRMFDGKISYGRGMMTNKAIYIPVDDEIFKYSLLGDQGKPVRLATAQVDLGTGAPVGNLFSDGEKIWVQGANRIYALGPSKD